MHGNCWFETRWEAVLLRTFRFSVVLLWSAVAIIACDSADTVEDSPEPGPVIGEDSGEAIAAREQEAALDEVLSEGLLTFTTGMVDARDGEGTWDPADIGLEFTRDWSFRTADASSAELQFGDFAVIHMDEETELVVDRLVDSAEQKDNRIDLVSGTLRGRLDRLRGDEDLRVRTDSSVAGVRGTSFEVSVDEAGRTSVAVLSGEIVLRPRAADDARERAHEIEDNDAREEMLALLDDLDEMVIIRAEEQAQALAGEFDVLNARIADAEQNAREISAAEEGERSALRGALRSLAVEIREQTARSSSPPEQIAPERLERIREVEAAPNLRSTAGIQTGERIAVSNLLRIQVDVTPSSALVRLGNSPPAHGRAQALVNPGQIMELRAEASGYLPLTERIVASDESRSFVFALEPEPSVEDASGDEPSVEEPSGEEPSGGVAAAEEEVPDPGAPAGEAAQEEPEDEPDAEESDPVERRIPTDASQLVADLAVDQDRLYGADFNGTIVAYRVSGEHLWRYDSSNRFNENSPPILSGGALHHTGSSEWVVLNPETGSELQIESLSDAEAHLFGRHIVSAGDFSIYPVNEELRVYDFSDWSRSRDIAIPGSSSMKPLFHDGVIYMANDSGTLFAFSLADGSEQFSVETPAQQPIGHAPVRDDASDLVVFLDRRGGVYAVDVATESLAWERRLDRARDLIVVMDPVVTQSKAYMIASNTLFGVDLANEGAELFTPIRDVSTAPMVHDGSLVYGTKDGRLIFADPQTGETRRAISLSGVANTRPRVVADRLAVGTRAGEILIIRP